MGGRGADLEALQVAVEKLVKVSQPLGRAMDYLQEDVDGMAKEASYWSEESRRYGQKIRGSELRGGANKELMATLRRLEEEIKDKDEEVLTLKSQILRNDAAVERLLDMVCYGAK